MDSSSFTMTSGKGWDEPTEYPDGLSIEDDPYY
jgi:hypothetical protein